MTTTQEPVRSGPRHSRPHPPRRSLLPGRAPKEARPGRPVHSPTVLQMEAVECGAASLAMVLGHYKKYVQLEELRISCGVSRDGSKAANVLKAARKYGLTAKGMQMEPSKLAEVKAPAILFWQFNHFVVFDGIKTRFGRKMVQLNDPGPGRRQVTMADFDDSFTGIVLTFEPGPDFQPGGRRPGILGALPARLQGTAGTMTVAVLASILLVLVGIATPAYTRAYVDLVLFGGDRSILLPLFSMMAATIGLTVALTALQQSHLLRTRIISSTLTSARFLRHLLRLPVSFFAQRNPADITARLQANDTVAEILTRDLSTVAVNLVVVFLYAFLLWRYDPQLTLIGIGVALLNIVALRMVSRIRGNRVAKLRTDTAKLVSTAYSGLQLIETMKATGGEGGYFQKWSGQHAAVLRDKQQLDLPSAVLMVVSPALAALNSALILLIGGLRAVDGHLSIGLLVAFQALVTAFTAPVTQLTAVAGRVQDFAADVTRLKDVEAFPIDPVYEQPEPDGAHRLNGYISLSDVTFGYNPLGPPLLKDFSLSVGPGQQAALVGGSGSGKSTVTKLVSGLFQVWSGEIRIDGQPRNEISRSALSASVAFVDQDIFLLEGTVRDNVTLWDPSIPDEEVVAALKDALVYDAVSARPGGIHSKVEQDGRNFSGGQRQRLEIARALVRNPSVLVLDEATSALDAETERTINDNLRRRGCACIVIAHRLSSVRESDEILVLEQGTVVERGRHDELIAAGGAYANLVKEH